MTLPMSRLAVTTAVGTTPGNRCRVRIRTRPTPRQLRCLDMRPGRKRLHLAAQDPGVVRPPYDRHTDQRVHQPGAERGDDRDRHQRAGQRQEQVGDAHQDGVDSASGRAGDQPDGAADEQPAGDNDQRGEPADLDTDQRAGQQVPADAVGAEQDSPVISGGRLIGPTGWIGLYGASTGARTRRAG